MNNLKKALILIALVFLTQIAIQAQTISSILKSVPDAVLFGVEASEIDQLLVEGLDSTVVVENELYRGLKRKNLSDDFISLHTSDSAFLQIRLLPLVNDSKIICVVKTVCASACDSHISFYTPTWKPISKADLYPKIDLNWFFKADADSESQEFKNVIASLDIQFVKLELSGKDENLAVALDLKSYLSKDDYAKLQPFLADTPKFLVWDKVSYK